MGKITTEDCVAKINEQRPGKWKRKSKTGNEKSGIRRVFEANGQTAIVMEKDGNLSVEFMTPHVSPVAVMKHKILFGVRPVATSLNGESIVWFASQSKFLSKKDDEDDDGVLSYAERNELFRVLEDNGLPGSEIEDGADGFSLEYELETPMDDESLRAKLTALGLEDLPKYRKWVEGEEE